MAVALGSVAMSLGPCLVRRVCCRGCGCHPGVQTLVTSRLCNSFIVTSLFWLPVLSYPFNTSLTRSASCVAATQVCYNKDAAVSGVSASRRTVANAPGEAGQLPDTFLCASCKAQWRRPEEHRSARAAPVTQTHGRLTGTGARTDVDGPGRLSKFYVPGT